MLAKTKNCCGISWLELNEDIILTAEIYDPNKCYSLDSFTAPELYLYGTYHPEKTVVYSAGAILRQLIFEQPAKPLDSCFAKRWDFSGTRFAAVLDADTSQRLSELLHRCYTLSCGCRWSLAELEKHIR